MTARGKSLEVDLNSDMGEGYGAYRMGGRWGDS